MKRTNMTAIATPIAAGVMLLSTVAAQAGGAAEAGLSASANAKTDVSAPALAAYAEQDVAVDANVQARGGLLSDMRGKMGSIVGKAKTKIDSAVSHSTGRVAGKLDAAAGLSGQSNVTAPSVVTTGTGTAIKTGVSGTVRSGVEQKADATSAVAGVAKGLLDTAEGIEANAGLAGAANAGGTAGAGLGGVGDVGGAVSAGVAAGIGAGVGLN